MDPTTLNVSELKVELKLRGLKTSGKKADLISRLEQALEDELLENTGGTSSATPITEPAVVDNTPTEKPIAAVEGLEKSSATTPLKSDTPVTESEKRRARAIKYQTVYNPTTAEVEQSKKAEHQKRLERAKRFGLTTRESELEKRRKRAARFNVSDPVLEKEKRRKRKERFTVKLSVEDQAKAKARQERFKAHLNA